MRTIPAAWQSAADAAATAGAHEQRVVVQLRISESPITDVWLTQIPVEADDTGRTPETGLKLWDTQGAWSTSQDNGPYPLLLSIPEVEIQGDIMGLAALSTVVPNLVASNARRSDLNTDLGVYRLSELRQNGYQFVDLDCWIHVLYRSIDWADRLSWQLKVNRVSSVSPERISWSMSDRVANGNDQTNARITSSDYSGAPLNRDNSPKPIVFGAGTVRALEVKRSTVFTDRTGQTESGGSVSQLAPTTGAPWSVGDVVTLGSGAGTVSSIAGTDDTDTVLTLSPVITRDSSHGEGDVPTDEQGYHESLDPTSSAMLYAWADPDFAPTLGEVRHRAPNDEELVPLPSYSGTPTEPDTGEILLDKRPRVGKYLSEVWAYGEDDGTTVTVSSTFTTLASSKLGLSASEYEVESGAGAFNIRGAIPGRISHLNLLQLLEKHARATAFWDGAKLKFRKRKTAAEVAAAGSDAVIQMAALSDRFPSIRDIPTRARTRGFRGRWSLDPLKSPDRADAYRGTKEVGSDASGREDDFWFPFIHDTTQGEELVDFYYETFGPMSDGNWPRYITGLRVDWSYMYLEREDIVELVVTDGEGNAFEGLDGGGTVLWRVLSKGLTLPDPRERTPGSVTLDLLEVHR